MSQLSLNALRNTKLASSAIFLIGANLIPIIGVLFWGWSVGAVLLGPLRRLCNGSPGLSDEFIWGYRAHGQYKRGRGHDVDHHQLFCEPFYIPHYAANARRV